MYLAGLVLASSAGLAERRRTSSSKLQGSLSYSEPRQPLRFLSTLQNCATIRRQLQLTQRLDGTIGSSVQRDYNPGSTSLISSRRRRAHLARCNTDHDKHKRAASAHDRPTNAIYVGLLSALNCVKRLSPYRGGVIESWHRILAAWPTSRHPRRRWGPVQWGAISGRRSRSPRKRRSSSWVRVVLANQACAASYSATTLPETPADCEFTCPGSPPQIAILQPASSQRLSAVIAGRVEALG